MRKDMKCSQVRKKLSAFVDSQASASDRVEIDRHLESCSECRQYAGELQGVSEDFSLIEDVAVRPYFLTRLKRRIQDQESSRWHLPVWIRRVAIPAGAVACIALTALLGSSLGRTVYAWRARRESAIGTTTTSAAGSVLLDQTPGGPLSRAYDQLLKGGTGG
jgi:predicted anti-sigma-YlaC factor YlaD